MENGEEVLVNLSRDTVVIGVKEYISFPAASLLVQQVSTSKHSTTILFMGEQKQANWIL